MHRLCYIFIILIMISCKHENENKIISNFPEKAKLIDDNATSETKFLFLSMLQLSKNHILYGNQDDIGTGISGFANNDYFDFKKNNGLYPAVFGWDIGNLGAESNIDSIPLNDIKKWIIYVYAMGGVNTISLHFKNPLNINDLRDESKAVSLILPGGKKHSSFISQLKDFAKFNSELVGSNGTKIPIILRTFHEQNANWYWWGKKYCTTDEYKNLFRFTVSYLRDSLNIHNLIYVYAPAGQFDDYMDRYPGDNFVDIMGFDYYFRNAINKNQIDLFTKKMIELTEVATLKNKLAAISETGYESIPDSFWHSKVLLNPVKENKDKIRLGYFLVWRNKSKSINFEPFAGQSSTIELKKLYADSTILFLNNIPNVYKDMP